MLNPTRKKYIFNNHLPAAVFVCITSLGLQLFSPVLSRPLNTAPDLVQLSMSNDSEALNSGVDLAPITTSKEDQNKVTGRSLKNFRDKGVQLGPLQLMQSSDEAKTETYKLVDSENKQISDLWDAALENNPDIQFVVQRLLPVKDPKHTTASVTKMLSTLLYGAVTAANVALPSTGTSGVNRAGVNLIQNALSSARSKPGNNSLMTDAEALMLHNVVRSTADRLVDTYHEYKKFLVTADTETRDLNDLSAITAEAKSQLSPAEQIQLEYFIRKSRREAAITELDLKRTRQELINLAGVHAMEKLDGQLDIEFAKDGNGTIIDSEATMSPMSEKSAP